MSYVELKPMLFDNLLGQYAFLFKLRDRLGNAFYKRKDMIAFNYNVENYKSFDNDKKMKSLIKMRKASFLILTDRQFSYITMALIDSGFKIEDIKTLSSVSRELISLPDVNFDDYKNAKREDIEELFNSNDNYRISEVFLKNKKKQIIIKIKGVFVFQYVDNNEIKSLLDKMIAAYNESQS